MKLSAAMLKGSEQRPQCRGGYYMVDVTGVLHSCALGAALEGVYGEPQFGEEVRGQLTEHFPALIDEELFVAITDRNDRGETREQIAAWLAEQGL